ncbi:unnamed protein product [Symbiodinium microadriaticum]|nr:unnamed protein product [Symbiodinium microadriaticum]
MAEKGRTGQTVCDIRERPARPISVIVILNNLANIVGTYFIAALATKQLEGVWATAFPFILTALVILLSEILPKTVGERYHAKIAWVMARPLYWATFIMTPVVWGIELFTGLLVKHRSIATTSENEIKALVRIGEQEGVIEDDEHNLISRVFEMNDKTACDIMTPRTTLTWIRGIEPISVAKEKVGKSQHSRVVVVGETLDDVKGIIHKSTILKLLVDGYDENALVEDYTEQVKFFHEDTPTDELLEHFKSSRVHLAVVIDNYGGLSGIVTLEDVLEVLTGEIVDETDRHTDMQQVALKKGRLRLKKESEKNGIVVEKPEGNAVRVAEIGPPEVKTGFTAIDEFVAKEGLSKGEINVIMSGGIANPHYWHEISKPEVITSRPRKRPVLHTGLQSLDYEVRLGGNLIVILGPTGTGKTAIHETINKEQTRQWRMRSEEMLAASGYPGRPYNYCLNKFIDNETSFFNEMEAATHHNAPVKLIDLEWRPTPYMDEKFHTAIADFRGSLFAKNHWGIIFMQSTRWSEQTSVHDLANAAPFPLVRMADYVFVLEREKSKPSIVNVVNIKNRYRGEARRTSRFPIKFNGKKHPFVIAEEVDYPFVFTEEINHPIAK